MIIVYVLETVEFSTYIFTKIFLLGMCTIYYIRMLNIFLTPCYILVRYNHLSLYQHIISLIVSHNNKYN